jgi:hypothetical protein
MKAPGPRAPSGFTYVCVTGTGTNEAGTQQAASPHSLPVP